MSAVRAVTVLVHGLWMNGLVMEMQRHFLTRMGLATVSYSYPSVKLTLTENADRLARFARTLAAPVVQWVGHSLGGVVILRMLEREAGLPPGRVVLLGVPCRGSRAGRALAGNSLGANLLGNSMHEWLKNPATRVPPRREIGIIAGSTGIGLGTMFAPELAHPHDGTVSVVETELPGSADHIVLPTTHTSMLLSHAVARQTARFMREGRFDHSPGGA